MKKILPIIILTVISIVSVSLYINISIEIKIENIKQEARLEGQVAVFQNIGDLVRKGETQINIPYTFTNTEGIEQQVNIPLLYLINQPTE